MGAVVSTRGLWDQNVWGGASEAVFEMWGPGLNVGLRPTAS